MLRFGELWIQLYSLVAFRQVWEAGSGGGRGPAQLLLPARPFFNLEPSRVIQVISEPQIQTLLVRTLVYSSSEPAQEP